jgi:hypothetical protein
MICVTDDNFAACSLQAQGEARQSFLIRPRKDMVVISHKSVIAVRHCIWGIEVDEISSLCVAHCDLKIAISKDVPFERVADLFDVDCVPRPNVIASPVWDIEVTLEILSVDPIEGQRAEIDETGSSPDFRLAPRRSDSVVVDLRIPKLPERSSDRFGAILNLAVHIHQFAI